MQLFFLFFFSAIGNPHPRTIVEGNLVRDILYGSRENVNFVHEVYRQSFLLSFSHSPAIKKVISVYKGRAHHMFSPILKLRNNEFISRICFIWCMYTVLPHIRPAGIILLQGLQLRVLLERGY